MKTKNAFAFRNFDSERILQRPYFKVFRFTPDKTDAEILSSVSGIKEDSIKILEQKLKTIKTIYNSLENFHKLIERHNETRLDKYNEKKMKVEGVTIFELKRHAPVLEYFTASLRILELMDKVRKKYYEIEKMIQERYRKELADRLKQMRQARGLKQKKLGELVEVSPQGFSLYERGERDIPIHTIIRLAKVLNVSSDELLGLK